jgi:hypothetical protein
MSNREIARELRIAQWTSKIHTAALLRAFGARNRIEAAFKAARIVRLRGNDTSLPDDVSEIRKPWLDQGKARKCST